MALPSHSQLPPELLSNVNKGGKQPNRFV